MQDITVYSKPDSTEPIVLPAGTKNITFKATDATNLVLLTDNNGNSYYVSDAELLKKEIESNWVPAFSNLFMAD